MAVLVRRRLLSSRHEDESAAVEVLVLAKKEVK